jgi:hypothetical protein
MSSSHSTHPQHNTHTPRTPKHVTREQARRNATALAPAGRHHRPEPALSPPPPPGVVGWPREHRPPLGVKLRLAKPSPASSGPLLYFGAVSDAPRRPFLFLCQRAPRLNSATVRLKREAERAHVLATCEANNPAPLVIPTRLRTQCTTRRKFARDTWAVYTQG